MSRNPTTLVTHTQPRRTAGVRTHHASQPQPASPQATADRRPGPQPLRPQPPGVSHLTSQHLSALSVSQPVKPPPPTGHSAPATGVWYSWDRRTALDPPRRLVLWLPRPSIARPVALVPATLPSSSKTGCPGRPAKQRTAWQRARWRWFSNLK